MATETVQMKVSGLMCSFCTMSLETAVKRNPGVKSVMVNLVHGIVLVEADTSQTTREALAGPIELRDVAHVRKKPEEVSPVGGCEAGLHLTQGALRPRGEPDRSEQRGHVERTRVLAETERGLLLDAYRNPA